MAEPTIFGEGILVGSKSVRLHAIDAATGEDIYMGALRAPLAGPPACISAFVFVLIYV